MKLLRDFAPALLGIAAVVLLAAVWIALTAARPQQQSGSGIELIDYTDRK